MHLGASVSPQFYFSEPLKSNEPAELGGALLTPESIATADATKKMVGSMMVYEASSIQDVEETVKNDIYYKNGVVSVQVGVRWVSLSHRPRQWDPER